MITKTAHIPYDIAGFHYPFAAYIAKCVRTGIPPLWDPLTYCGYPFHADMQTQLFYLPAWIPVLLGNLSSGRNLYYWYQWLIPLHMILGGLFTFCLLRALRCRIPVALLGAVVYQLGGFFASQAQHVGAICCGAWLPLSVLAVIRLSERASFRWIALLAVSFCGAILAGFAQTAAIVLITAGMVAIAYIVTGEARRRLLLYYSAATLLTGLACAAMLGPAWQLSKLSMASLRSQFLVTGGGLRLQSLVSLAIPDYYHIFTPLDAKRYKLPINFTFLYLYCGIIPLGVTLLAPWLVRSRNVWRFWILTVISAFWMLGDATPVYRTIYSILPAAVQGALYSEYAMMPFCLFLGVTAALAIENLRAPAIRKLSWALALITAADLMWFGSNRPMNAAPGSWRTVPTEKTWQYGAASLNEIRTLLSHQMPPERIDLIDNSLLELGMSARVYGIPSATGDSPFVLLRMLELRRLLGDVTPWTRVIPATRSYSPLLDLMNVGYVQGVTALDPSKDVQRKFDRLVIEPGIQLYRNRLTLPRFFVVHRVDHAASKQEALQWISRPDFRPSEEAIVEGAEKDLKLNDSDTSSPTVLVERYTANRIDLRVASGSRALLVASEAFYPGWKATRNGKDVPVLLTDYAFRGVIIGAGVNEITFTYWPQRFWLWMAMSVAGIAGMLAFLAKGRTAQKLDMPAQPELASSTVTAAGGPTRGAGA